MLSASALGALANAPAATVAVSSMFRRLNPSAPSDDFGFLLELWLMSIGTTSLQY
jgi:hypothetical protein